MKVSFVKVLGIGKNGVGIHFDFNAGRWKAGSDLRLLRKSRSIGLRFASKCNGSESIRERDRPVMLPNPNMAPRPTVTPRAPTKKAIAF